MADTPKRRHFEDDDYELIPLDPSDDTRFNEVMEQNVERARREREQKEMIKRLIALHQGGFVKYTKVENMTTEIVSDAERAEGLYQRHKNLVIAPWVADQVWAAQGDSAKMAGLYKHVSRYGGFLQDERNGYSIEDMSKRIQDPHWLIVEGEASIVDPDSASLRPPAKVADMHLLMPDVHAQEAVAHVPHPDESGAFFDGRRTMATTIARHIHDRPSIAACVSDIAVFPLDYQNRGIGTAVQTRSIEHVRTVINPVRGTQDAIRYYLASMFSIREIRQGGQTVVLPSRLQNDVSIFFHGLRTPNSCLAWNSPTTEIKVLVPPERPDEPAREFTMVVDWITAAMDISEPTVS